jgi:hypothetical protein
MSVNHWTGRILKVLQDTHKMGRWTGHQYRLDGERTLSVITAYRSCTVHQSQEQTSSQSIHRQQAILLNKQKRKDKNPRNAFINDILSFIQDITKDPNNHCVLMLDANEATTDKEGGVRNFFNETPLVDAFSKFSDSVCDIATYVRGRKRLDYILTSQDLLPYTFRIPTFLCSERRRSPGHISGSRQ